MHSSRLLSQLTDRPLLLRSWLGKSLLCSRSTTLARSQACPTAAQWLEDTSQRQQSSNASSTTATAGLSASIIHQADSLKHARLQRRLESASSADSTATSSTLAMIDTSTQHPASPGSVVLQQQQFQVPADFCVPADTSVPVHQLVAVFHSMLGSPVLPKEARLASMEGKWRLLRLLLQHGPDGSTGAGRFEAELQRLLQFALQGELRKLEKVLSNPRIPEVNKQLAQRQFDKLWTTCRSSICDWAHAACSSPAFALLQPAMAQLKGAISWSVARSGASTHQQANRSVEAGKLMEAAAVQAVRDALPEGWTLLTSLHLLGVDGQPLPSSQRGCKYEADMLVLDQRGVAVAIVEVKLAAANPLMALVNDLSGLLRLIDTAAGRVLTCLTRDNATAAAAAAAAGEQLQPLDAPVYHPDLHTTVCSMTARPQFGTDPGWHVLHVKVQSDVLPVYVLGNGISPKAVTRGLNSLVSSSTLKLLSRSPAALAAALASRQQDPFRELLGAAGCTCSSSSSSSSGDDTVGAAGSVASHHSSSSCADSTGDELPDAPAWQLLKDEPCSQQHSTASSPPAGVLGAQEGSGCGIGAALAAAAAEEQGKHSMQGGGCTAGVGVLAAAWMQGRPDSLASLRARVRAHLRLEPQQQQQLTERIRGKVALLQQRCKIYSLIRLLD